MIPGPGIAWVQRISMITAAAAVVTIARAADATAAAGSQHAVSTDSAGIADSARSSATQTGDSLTGREVPAAQAGADPAGTAANRAPVSAGFPPAAPPGPAMDTAAIFVGSPRVGIGVGWALGSFSLFDQWQEGLPDSLSHYRLSSSMPCRDLGIPADDTVRLKLVVREKPDAYNVHFPVYLTWTPMVRNRLNLTTQVSGFLAWKKVLEALEPESLSYTLDIDHHLAFGSVALGVLMQYALPEEWFSIDKVDATMFTAGVAAHPLSVLYQRTSLSGTNALPDSLDGLSPILEAAVRDRFRDVTAFGMGISWQVGITTLSMATAGKGFMFGILYEGQWFGLFHENGTSVNVGHISPASSHPGAALRSLSHRFVVQAQLMRGSPRASELPAAPPTPPNRPKDGKTP